MSNLNLMELPHEPFERRKALLLHGIDERVDFAIVRFQKHHGKGSFYETCHTFVFHELYDARRSDFNSLKRVVFFPWLEIQRELSEAVNHAFLASYKATFDNYRRALEVAIAGAYFLQAHISEDDAKRWLRSERETPLLTRALSDLVQSSRFRHVDAQSSWSSHLKAFYWRLCDIVHVRGEKASFGSIQPSHAHRGGCINLCFRRVAPSLCRLQQENDEIISVTDWFNSLPDISDEEIDRQIRDQEEWIKFMQGKDKENNDG